MLFVKPIRVYSCFSNTNLCKRLYFDSLLLCRWWRSVIYGYTYLEFYLILCS